MDNVFILFRVSCFIGDIPTKGFKERVDEFYAELGLVVGRASVGLDIALEALNQDGETVFQRSDLSHVHPHELRGAHENPGTLVSQVWSSRLCYRSDRYWVLHVQACYPQHSTKPSFIFREAEAVYCCEEELKRGELEMPQRSIHEGASGDFRF